jgi:hypothetical protein
VKLPNLCIKFLGKSALLYKTGAIWFDFSSEYLRLQTPVTKTAALSKIGVNHHLAITYPIHTVNPNSYPDPPSQFVVRSGLPTCSFSSSSHTITP